VVDELVAKTAFDAEIAFVYRCAVIGGNPYYLAILHVEIEIASSTAIGACCLDLLYSMSATFTQRWPFYKSTDWTGRYALSAKDAVIRVFGYTESGVRDSRKTPSDQVDSSFCHYLMADSDATSAKYAFVWIEIDQRVIVVYRQVSADARNRIRLNFVEIGEVLKVTVAAFSHSMQSLG